MGTAAVRDCERWVEGASSVLSWLASSLPTGTVLGMDLEHQQLIFSYLRLLAGVVGGSRTARETARQSKRKQLHQPSSWTQESLLQLLPCRLVAECSGAGPRLRRSH